MGSSPWVTHYDLQLLMLAEIKKFALIIELTLLDTMIRSLDIIISIVQLYVCWSILIPLF
jgi:hypothetical protein